MRFDVLAAALTAFAMLPVPGLAQLELHDDGVRFPDGTLLTSAAGSYANVITVAKSGGHYTSIQAALDSITDASDSNRYLVWVGPGTYTEQVDMRAWVDIQGSGEGLTKISSDGTTVLLAAELRFLTVESTGGSDAIAVRNTWSGRMTNVTATASGGSVRNVGVENDWASLTMTNVIATASGGTEACGVTSSDWRSSLQMTNVTATASGATLHNRGVYIRDTTQVAMTNVIASGSGGTNAYGVDFYSADWDARPKMRGVTATGSDGTWSFGVHSIDSHVEMDCVTAIAEGDTHANAVYGGEDEDGSLLWIRYSTLRATGRSSSHPLNISASSHAYVAYSHFRGSGDAVCWPETCTCLGVYEADLSPLDAICK